MLPVLGENSVHVDLILLSGSPATHHPLFDQRNQDSNMFKSTELFSRIDSLDDFENISSVPHAPSHPTPIPLIPEMKSKEDITSNPQTSTSLIPPLIISSTTDFRRRSKTVPDEENVYPIISSFPPPDSNLILPSSFTIVSPLKDISKAKKLVSTLPDQSLPLTIGSIVDQLISLLI